MDLKDAVKDFKKTFAAVENQPGGGFVANEDGTMSYRGVKLGMAERTESTNPRDRLHGQLFEECLIDRRNRRERGVTAKLIKKQVGIGRDVPVPGLEVYAYELSEEIVGRDVKFRGDNPAVVLGLAFGVLDHDIDLWAKSRYVIAALSNGEAEDMPDGVTIYLATPQSNGDYAPIEMKVVKFAMVAAIAGTNSITEAFETMGITISPEDDPTIQLNTEPVN